jgi:hypothetical protein
MQQNSPNINITTTLGLYVSTYVLLFVSLKQLTGQKERSNYYI